MANARLTISKVLLKAVLLSFLTILLTTVVVFLIMVATPDTVYHKILGWMMLNKFNPEIYYTDYYRGLSQIAGEEDWMLVTPLAYLFGGAVFGLVLSSKRDRNYTLQTSSATAFVFTAAVLAMCYFSPDILEMSAARAGVDFRPGTYSLSDIGIGVIQTIYWTIAFSLGSLVGYTFRVSRSRPRLSH